MFPAVVEVVAFLQLFMSYADYVLIEVDSKGIDGPLEIDNVAEFSAYLGHQWIVNQESISMKHLKFMYKRRLTEDGIKYAREQVMNKLHKPTREIQKKTKKKK